MEEAEGLNLRFEVWCDMGQKRKFSTYYRFSNLTIHMSFGKLRNDVMISGRDPILADVV